MMIGMSESQLTLMFEYIELISNLEPYNDAEVARMVEIRKILIDEARATEENRQRIVESLAHLGNRKPKLKHT
jgi:hypothetical protein